MTGKGVVRGWNLVFELLCSGGLFRDGRVVRCGKDAQCGGFY